MKTSCKVKNPNAEPGWTKGGHRCECDCKKAHRGPHWCRICQKRWFDPRSRVSWLIPLAGLIIICGACGSSKQVVQTQAPTTVSPVSQFTSDLNAADPIIATNGWMTLAVDLGQGACTDLNNGGGVNSLAEDSINAENNPSNPGLVPKDLADIDLYAVRDLCPQYSQLINGGP